MEDLSDRPKPAFKDRSLGLLIFGIFEILIGVFCALLVPLSLVALTFTPASMRSSTDLRSMIPAVVLYLFMAVVFIVLGIGSIRARRWACDLMLSLSWVWLLTGICTLVLAWLLMPSLLSEMGSSAGLPPRGMLLVGLVTAAILSFVYVLLPGAFVLFYRSPHVIATCRARDLRVQWTDDCPPRILSLAVVWAITAVSVLVMPAYRFVMPFFGVLVDGAVGAVLWLLVLIVFAALAWGTCRRRLWAWWGGVFVTVVAAVSSVLTFARIDLLDFYRAIELPADQLALLSALATPGRGTVALLWLVVWGSFLAYLASVRKLFRTPAAKADG